jgi:4-amino-4-deoxy-L-arabinose transferase-like glycosyltransferase
MIGAIAALYLIVTLAYSLQTPAWEGNDEAYHVAYIEYIVTKQSLPQISEKNGWESHQPPLYYVLAALWQNALRIPSFVPDQRGPTAPPPGTPPQTGPRLQLAHDYSDAERVHAFFCHQLRLLSVLFGLGTVILTFYAALLATGMYEVAAGASLFVALLPKFNVVSAMVNNDAPVIMLSTGALTLLLYYLRGARLSPRRRTIVAAALGIVLGMAVLTKLSSLPLVVALLPTMLLARQALRQRVPDVLAAALSFAAVTIPYFYRNYNLYGEILAQRVSNDYLSRAIPGLIVPVGLTDEARFQNFVPLSAMQTVWYNGGWNQFVAPFLPYLILSLLGGVGIFSGLRAYAVGATSMDIKLDWRAGVSLLAGLLAGIAAIVRVAMDAIQAEGRIAYGGLAAFAIVAVLGLTEAVGGSRMHRRIAAAIWPVSLLIFNVYVYVHFVFPFRHL